jgi:hypothetical protein
MERADGTTRNESGVLAYISFLLQYCIPVNVDVSQVRLSRIWRVCIYQKRSELQPREVCDTFSGKIVLGDAGGLGIVRWRNSSTCMPWRGS